MRAACWLVLCFTIGLTACGDPSSITPPPTLYSFTSVTPSPTGSPNSVAIDGNYEFVSVQTTGQIFVYNFSSGSQVQVAMPYATPCKSPSGMAVVPEGAKTILAVTCYDTSVLLTLNIAADGSLSALGTVALGAVPYLATVSDGTNVYVPLSHSGVNNGAVARVDVSNPTAPAVTAITTLASPFPGAIADGVYLALSGGYIYVAAGSETTPLSGSSSVQVVNESTMQLVGTPLVVVHSPQQIAVSGTVVYVTLFDAEAFESIDVSNPASLKALDTLSLTATPGCSALALALRQATAYVGCYAETSVSRMNVSTPASMSQINSISGVGSPQALTISGDWMFVVSSAAGGSVYQVYVGPTN
jgi:hypothetical protein